MLYDDLDGWNSEAGGGSKREGIYVHITLGFPDRARGKEPTYQYRRHKRHRLDLGVGKVPWRRACQLSET